MQVLDFFGWNVWVRFPILVVEEGGAERLYDAEMTMTMQKHLMSE